MRSAPQLFSSQFPQCRRDEQGLPEHLVSQYCYVQINTALDDDLRRKVQPIEVWWFYVTSKMHPQHRLSPDVPCHDAPHWAH